MFVIYSLAFVRLMLNWPFLFILFVKDVSTFGALIPLRLLYDGFGRSSRDRPCFLVSWCTLFAYGNFMCFLFRFILQIRLKLSTLCSLIGSWSFNLIDLAQYFNMFISLSKFKGISAHSIINGVALNHFGQPVHVTIPSARLLSFCSLFNRLSLALL